MRFQHTALHGVLLILPEPSEDERGLLARTFCQSEFARQHLPTAFAQCSLVVTHRRGTLRGMHWQAAPALESKLLRCTRGAIYEIALDLRRDSPTYMRSVAYELSQDSRRQLWIPGGCAHGFQTLVDDCEVHYSMTAAYQPELQRGVRWDDPAFALQWPLLPPILSPRDATFQDWEP
jgi:dTDP-4-dehydrorhamnose 3,5-epimerase